jgi:four helix bundle protein
MQNYRRLRVWERAHHLAKDIHLATRDWPRNGQYALSAQVRRAAVSIPSNIAEGCGRGGRRELLRFLSLASGSAYELESQLLLAVELGYQDPERGRVHLGEVATVKRMLSALHRRIGSEL